MTTIRAGNLDIGGATFEASDGTKLAVMADATTLRVYKNLDTTPVQVIARTSAIFFDVGAGDIGWFHAAIDSNDVIHIVLSGTVEATYDVVYTTVTDPLGTPSWGINEEAYDYSEDAPTSPGCAISIDSNDKPHILVVDNVKQTGSSQDNVYYTEKTGASWASPTQIGTRSTKTDRYVCPFITMRNSDYIEAWYYFDVGAFEMAYKSWTGSSWTAESLYGVQGNLGKVTATSGGTVYRNFEAYSDEEIKENNVGAGYYTIDTVGDEYHGLLDAALSGSNRYIFYIDTGEDIHLISNDGGGWTDEGDLQVGTYEAVIAGWSYNNLNNRVSIDYIYSDGTNVYWGEKVLPRVFVTHV